MEKLAPIIALRERFSKSTTQDINENLKHQSWTRAQNVKAGKLRLKNYRMRRAKEREPGLPKNPYLKRNFKSVQRSKMKDQKKFKSFRLFQQSDLNFEDIEVQDAEMAQMYSDDDYTTDEDEIVKS